MRIIFVRHGHPNYEKDCLTELGHRHAAAAAERLRHEGIERIYSSTCGRAFETAQHLGNLIALPVIGCDFMREISWGSVDGPAYADGHPWTIADQMVARGEPLVDTDWRTHSDFCRNRLLDCCDKVAAGADAWLAENTAEHWDGAVVTKPVSVSDMHAWLKNHPGAFIAALNQ